MSEHWLLIAASAPSESSTLRVYLWRNLRGLGAQLLWILIGLAIFRIAWRSAIKRYSAVGG